MLCMKNILIFLNTVQLVFATLEKHQFYTDDLETAESITHVESKPSPHENEFRRWQSFQNVFPPEGVLFSPHGQRTTIVFKYPQIQTQKWNLNHLQQSPVSTPTEYGALFKIPSNTQKSLYSQPQPPPRGKDNAIISSQHYHYRANVRYNQTYENISNQSPPKPADELIIEFAKAIAQRQDNPKDNTKTKSSSFVLISLESRLKTGPNFNKFGFPGGESWTNGTIIFPSPKNPSILTNIPFTLVDNSDLGYVLNSESQGLTSKVKSQIKVFLKLVSKVHAQKHDDGIKTIHNLLEFESTLRRPRLTVPQGLDTLPEDDPISVEKDTQARLDNWLYTSTVGLRDISSSNEDFLDSGKPYVTYEHVPTTY